MSSSEKVSKALVSGGMQDLRSMARKGLMLPMANIMYASENMPMPASRKVRTRTLRAINPYDA